MSEVQPDQLTLAEVDWRDEPEELPLTEQHAELATLREALGQHPMIEALGMGGAARGQRSLAHQLAYLLPFQPEQKLELLRLDDPSRQLENIQLWLEQLQGDGAQ